MPNIEKLRKYKNIHMVGIGGISMSGIAEILHNFGFNITGSSNEETKITQKLKENGIKVILGHKPENVIGSDIVIYTAAVKQDNVELIKAKEMNIPIIERSTFLGEITKCYKDTITVAGTHGKSTTTSMISLCFLEALKDPSIQVGAELHEINGNYKVGNSEFFIIEACEYVESFLKFSPKAEVILNIDNDHLDYFKNFDNIKNAFIKYVQLLPNDGILVINGDDENCYSLTKYTNSKTLTYGITNKNVDFLAKNIIFDKNGFPEFDVYYKNKFLIKIKLNVTGIHNVLNSLGCISLCSEYNISLENIKSGLAKFTGVERRFEYKGQINGANIYDDYGHHPTEIMATAKALVNKQFNNSWVIFQPHTYSRTKLLLDDFANALINFDNIVILDIYAAREINTYNISSKDLVSKIQDLGKNAKYISNFEECVSYIKKNVKPNDIILTLGAGTVTEIGDMLIK